MGLRHFFFSTADREAYSLLTLLVGAMAALAVGAYYLILLLHTIPDFWTNTFAIAIYVVPIWLGWRLLRFLFDA